MGIHVYGANLRRCLIVLGAFAAFLSAGVASAKANETDPVHAWLNYAAAVQTATQASDVFPLLTRGEAAHLQALPTETAQAALAKLKAKLAAFQPLRTGVVYSPSGAGATLHISGVNIEAVKIADWKVQLQREPTGWKFANLTTENRAANVRAYRTWTLQNGRTYEGMLHTDGREHVTIVGPQMHLINIPRAQLVPADVDYLRLGHLPKEDRLTRLRAEVLAE